VKAAEPPKARVMESARLKAIGPPFVALFVLAIALPQPWWSVTLSSPSDEISFEFGLRSMCISSPPVCIEYAPLASADSDYIPLRNVFAGVLALLAAALALTLGSFLLGLRRGRSPYALLGSIICALGGGLAVVAALAYLLLGLPSAYQAAAGPPFANVVTGFFGSTSAEGTSVTYRGAIGWWLCLVAAFFLWTGVMLGFLETRTARKAGGD